mgnify:CR=1 FL=1
MADRYKRTTIGDLRGGRNGVDPPLAIKENQCVDAVNVEWFQTTLGRKRNGMSSAGVTFSSGGPFTGKISSIFRHVPGTDETLAVIFHMIEPCYPAKIKVIYKSDHTAVIYR